MSKNKAKKILQQTPRRRIRYVLYRIKGGTADADDMPYPELVDVVQTHYPRQVEKLLGIQGQEVWDTFAERWDIGLDDAGTIMSRWDGYLDKIWYTLGISKLLAVANPGAPAIVRFGQKYLVTPGAFFAERGCAHEVDGRIVPDIGKLLEHSPTRKAWVEEGEIDHGDNYRS